MKRTLRLFNCLFKFLVVLSLLLMIIVIVYTFIDLYYTSDFDISSKDSIDRFIGSFNWCKTIIGNALVMFSTFYVFQTFKVHYENKLLNNYVTPKERSLKENLDRIKSSNTMMYNFIVRNSMEIMKNIINTEDNNRIISKNRLEHYFKKFVKKEVKNFECSRYYGEKCKGICRTCNMDKNPNIQINSFDQFNMFAFDLFCISFNYSDFDNDIKSIYEAT